MKTEQVGALGSLEGLRSYPLDGRVRAVFGGETIATTESALVLHEPGQRPVLYFPRADVRLRYLAPSPRQTYSATKGDAHYWSLRVGSRQEEDSAWSYECPVEAARSIRNHLAFFWDRIDAWFIDGQRIDRPEDIPTL